MSRTIKATGAILLLAAGATILAYYALPAFKGIVDELAFKFRADMAECEDALVQVLSSAEEEVTSAQDA